MQFKKKNQDELSILNINSSLYEIQSDHFSDYELSLNANCWKTKLVLCGLEILDNKMKKKRFFCATKSYYFSAIC